MTELQRFQWTMSGMRADDSELGAMWFYRGFDTDLEMMRLHEMIELLKESRANGDVLAELVSKDEEIAKLERRVEEKCSIIKRLHMDEIQPW